MLSRGLRSARASIVKEHWLSLPVRKRAKEGRRLETGMRLLRISQEPELYDRNIPDGYGNCATFISANRQALAYSESLLPREREAIQEELEREEQEAKSVVLNDPWAHVRGHTLRAARFPDEIISILCGSGIEFVDDLVGATEEYLTVACGLLIGEARYTLDKLASLDVVLSSEEQEGLEVTWAVRRHKATADLLGDHDVCVNAVFPAEARWYGWQRYQTHFVKYADGGWTARREDFEQVGKRQRRLSNTFKLGAPLQLEVWQALDQDNK